MSLSARATDRRGQGRATWQARIGAAGYSHEVTAMGRGRRNGSLRRLFRVAALLKHGRTLPGMATTVGVTQRTVRRDLDTLRFAGVEFVKDDGGVYRLTGSCVMCAGLMSASRSQE